MKYQAIEYIMDQLDIEVFSVADVGKSSTLNTVYEKRALENALTGFEPKEPFRCAPRSALSGAKSIIAIGVPYETKNSLVTGIPRGFVTNMAWAYDYHHVVEQKLEQIREALRQSHPDASFLLAVDTGPINDRMAAYGAGLGWIGRNQFIIDERIGTGFYIGIIVTDFKIDGALPWREGFESKCADCRKCQKACPTGALCGDYGFNGQRCISSLTQLKRELTYDECHSIGKSLYGCDLCQWACPQNARVSEVPAELRRSSPNLIDPFEILKLSNKAFKKAYGQMGFAWRGLRILKRNALIVIGNDGKKADFDPLVACMDQLNPVLSKYAVYAMMLTDLDRALGFFSESEKLREEVFQMEQWIYQHFRYRD
jgi:epoxyqueuosine reductase